MSKQRTVYLDIVRVVACMMVIVIHAPISGIEAEHHGAFLVLISYLMAPCVPLFFMVSGALLLPCRGDTTAIEFLRKRISKILGPTVFFSLFYILLDINKDGYDIIKKLLSIPFSPQGHGVLWFMYVLTGLYLLVPVISPWLRQTSKRELEFYLLIWIVTQCYPYLSMFVGIDASNTGVLYYFTGYIGYFLLGYYLDRYTIAFKWLFLLTILVLPFPLFDKMLNWNLDFYAAFWYLSLPVTVMTVTWFVGLKILCRVTVLGYKLLTFSNLSFGIYLIHIYIMRSLLWKWSLILSIQNYYLQTLVVALLTFAFSYFVCKIISYLPYSQYVIGYSVRNNKY